MKYCPQCNRKYSEEWLTFCTVDGSLLREDLSPPADPNWDPQIRGAKFEEPSEQQTQWLPRDPPTSGGWIAPDERAPVTGPWQPPPPPPQPVRKSSTSGMAVASFVLGLIGIVAGWFCLGPIPGVLAVILGFVALAQMRNSPTPSNRGLAIAGIVLGGINLLFFGLGLLWWFLSAFG